ncbi:hypothetical protein N3C_1460 [Clostridium sp. N3C]|uniref:O-antigen ligase family protein n=1 Tax=Clostridium sp. N3C TaxID=1776758 RepID=UPI00092DF5E4|nr:O-antigen ligase family protein [Clostridium sp. N3C]SCN23727.1 hypothetical protein N3C_1460 [Clostridium sp. N3C]
MKRVVSNLINLDIKKINIQLVFIVLFSMSPLIDSLNGLIIKSGVKSSITIGQIYRFLIILILAFFWLRNFKLKKYVVFLSIFSYFVIAILIHDFIGSTTQSVISELIDLSRWLLLPFMLFVFISLNKEGEIKRKAVSKVLYIFSILVPLTLLIPYVMGVGYGTYYSTGYKGFYYSTNALSYTLIICFFYSLNKLLNNFSKKYIVTMILNVVCIILVGAKAGFLFTFLIFILSVGNKLRLYIKQKENSNFNIRTILIILVIFFATIFLVFVCFYDKLFYIWERQKYLFADSTGLLSYLTSKRTDRIPLYFNEISSSSFTLIRVLFGSGDMTDHLLLIEMDFFDLFFTYGILAVLIFVGVLGYFVKYRNGKGSKFYLYAFCLSLIYSFWGGHVLNNALGSSVFALVCFGMILNA